MSTTTEDQNHHPEEPKGAGFTVSRRTIAKAGALGLGAALIGGSAHATGNEEPFASEGRQRRQRWSGEKPNILFIMADDLGWADLSSYGAPHIKTPNLDRLAREGVRFTQAYSGSSTCSPTRVSLYTGRYPGRVHVGLSEPIVANTADQGLPSELPTLASLLREAGYHTAMHGKWHVGGLPYFSPNRSGWNEFLGSFGGGIDYFSKIDATSPTADYDFWENEVKYHDLRYYTEIVTERTEQFLRRRHDKPWLVNLNYTTPHWPWEGPKDQAVSDELSARARAGEQRVMFHNDGGSVAKYAEMVEDMDRSVGRVLDTLRRTGQHRNTIVVFKSDNGGERFSYQWPLTGSKWEVSEGGIRVPTIIRWPERIRGNQVSHEPVVTMDWTRTLLAAAGVSPHSDYPMDGRDLSDYLWGSGVKPEGDLFWRVVDQGALRRGRWKYWFSNNPERQITAEKLFDLDVDQREKADLSKKKPEMLATLRTAWNEINTTLLAYPPGARRFGT